MIQVDVFWSFAIGACLADAVSRSRTSNAQSYFLYNVLLLSLIFAPSGVFLLWNFPGWETMWGCGFTGLTGFPDWDPRPQALHAIFPTIFAHTNVLLGIIGFWVVHFLKSAKWDLTGRFLWVFAYTCMFAILAFNYDRFFYAGTYEEWIDNKPYPWTDWFGGEVFYTLLAMAVPLVPALYFPCLAWPQPETRGEALKRSVSILFLYFLSTAVFAAAFFYVQRNNIIPDLEYGLVSFTLPLVQWRLTFHCYHRLFAFCVFQVLIAIITALPFALSITVPRPHASSSKKLS